MSYDRQALVLAKNRASQYQSILDNVRAIIFLSTPHSGGHHDALVELYARAVQVSKAELGYDLIQEIAPNSDGLYDLGRDFVQIVESDGIAVCTLFEMQKMPIGKMNCLVSVVSGISATVVTVPTNTDCRRALS